ncbi:MAG TPA: ferredoxin [Eubacteriales bacterium]|nr:ferredoxin [Eubacteriales bacterium]
MKAKIDREGCIGCGLCTTICPEVFRMGDDDKAEVYVTPIPANAENTALDASGSCPVSVISVE